MFRFWYRYVFGNRMLIETGAGNAVWERRIKPDLSNYMGHVFERICREYLLAENVRVLSELKRKEFYEKKNLMLW